MKNDWYQRTFQRELNEFQLFQRFECPRVSPDVLDALLADGWRHFGVRFFRDLIGVVDHRFRTIIPLRIDLSRFVASKSQRRILRKNQDLLVRFQDAAITQPKELLFLKHSSRFTHNQPHSLLDFLSSEPGMIPCVTKECSIFLENQLIAVSFLDLGQVATSSVYAMFDLEFSHRSLGIFTLLKEIEFSVQLNKRYLYLGYAHIEPSFYEYKKHFTATEFYDWQGSWLPLEQVFLDQVSRPMIDGMMVPVLDSEPEPEPFD